MKADTPEEAEREGMKQLMDDDYGVLTNPEIKCTGNGCDFEFFNVWANITGEVRMEVTAGSIEKAKREAVAKCRGAKYGENEIIQMEIQVLDITEK